MNKTNDIYEQSHFHPPPRTLQDPPSPTDDNSPTPYISLTLTLKNHTTSRHATLSACVFDTSARLPTHRSHDIRYARPIRPLLSHSGAFECSTHARGTPYLHKAFIASLLRRHHLHSITHHPPAAQVHRSQDSNNRGDENFAAGGSTALEDLYSTGVVREAFTRLFNRDEPGLILDSDDGSDDDEDWEDNIEPLTFAR
jgi:hypothetical protein